MGHVLQRNFAFNEILRKKQSSVSHLLQFHVFLWRSQVNVEDAEKKFRWLLFTKKCSFLGHF